MMKMMIDPVCGMKVSSSKLNVLYDEKEYFFCSNSCKNKFENTPQKYLDINRNDDITDLVCGMTVKSPKINISYEGVEYYFCCEKCKEKFIDNPEYYLTKSPVLTSKPENPGNIGGEHKKVVYIGPMDPEVRELEMGDCPICGMALEPSFESLNINEFVEHLSASELSAKKEWQDYSKRFWISLFFTLPVFILEMGNHLLDVPLGFSPKVTGFIGMLSTSLVMFWLARPIFKKLLDSLKNRKANMWTLIGMGTLITYVYSIFAYLFSYLDLKNNWSINELPVYFETSAVIITLVLFGQVLELKARSKTGSTIQSLVDLFPKTVLKIQNGSEIETPLNEIKEGDRVRIHPGEKIPADGKVIAGLSSVNEAMLTGEAIPLEKKNNDQVIGGSVNGSGVLEIVVTQTGSDSFLAHLIESVVNAQKTRPQIQRYADVVSGYFVPIVMIVAVSAFITWFLVGPSPSVLYAMLAMVSVLIIACPCAIGLATPMSIMVSVGKAAEYGILVKNAEALEIFSKVDKIVLDKTGTLTEGRPKVSRIVDIDGAGDENKKNIIINIAFALESNSTHPLAEAVKDKMTTLREEIPELTPMEIDQESFENIIGMGIVGNLHRHNDWGLKASQIALGNEQLLKRLGTLLDPNIKDMAEKLSSQEGKSVVYVYYDGKVQGFLVIEDTIRHNALLVINQLKQLGIEVILATGDRKTTAEYIAKQLGIMHCYAEVLPQDKAKIVKDLQHQGHLVAMVGDGINDTPVLAQADVGIAIGDGSDAAVEAAGVTLIKNHLLGILRLQKLSKATLTNIKQNLFFAFVYNVTGIPIAAGILYPWLGVLLSPMIASLAMSLSSVSVIINALRLRSREL